MRCYGLVAGHGGRRGRANIWVGISGRPTRGSRVNDAFGKKNARLENSARKNVHKDCWAVN
jgi:hypothetical protein